MNGAWLRQLPGLLGTVTGLHLGLLMPVLTGLVLAYAAGCGTGIHLTHTAAEAKALKAAERQAAVLDKARVEGQQALDALHAQQQTLQAYRSIVEQRTSHAPLLAAAPFSIPRRPAGDSVLHAAGVAGLRALAAGDAGGGIAAAAVAAAAASTVPAAVGAAEDASATPDAGGLSDVLLSLAAVSLWNSALVGHDVPAGACRADDTTSTACAAGSGLGIADAWHNAAVNAASCAEDRARHQALIDFLRRTR